jgi:hypothetical protein
MGRQGRAGGGPCGATGYIYTSQGVNKFPSLQCKDVSIPPPHPPLRGTPAPYAVLGVGLVVKMPPRTAAEQDSKKIIPSAGPRAG